MLRNQERIEQLKQSLKEKELEQKNTTSTKPRGVLHKEVERARYKLQLAQKSGPELQNESKKLQAEIKQLEQKNDSFSHFCSTPTMMHRQHIREQLKDVEEEMSARETPVAQRVIRLG